MTYLESAKSEIDKAQRRMLGSYLEQIRKTYLALPSNKRQFLLLGLEMLLEKPDVSLKGNFPRLNAREVREDKGLTQQELAEEIGIPRTTIAKYEAGMTRRESGKAIKKYVAWLKGQGYTGESLR